MRISDWSSDVCSSDLPLSDQPGAGDRDRVWPDTDREVGGKRNAPARRGRSARRLKSWLNGFFCLAGARGRSEEHTSELQSLMRISYAVFCLKKTKTTTQHKQSYTSYSSHDKQIKRQALT